MNSWRTVDHPPAQINSLTTDEVHVWRTTLDWSAESIHDLTQLLAADEREKAARFRFEEDRRRAVIGRGALRILLGHALDIAPQAVRFVYGRYGKPALVDGLSSRRLAFNVSHAGDFILLALTQAQSVGVDNVGVDVEQMRMDIDYASIATHHFSPAEQQVLADLPDEFKADAFFRCWTRKEAYIKGVGAGLTIPLAQFDVSLLPDQPARLLATRHAPGEHRRWQLIDLELGPGYKAALAVKGAECELRCWEWPTG